VATWYVDDIERRVDEQAAWTSLEPLGPGRR
jgi:hypothetical protein